MKNGEVLHIIARPKMGAFDLVSQAITDMSVLSVELFEGQNFSYKMELGARGRNSVGVRYLFNEPHQRKQFVENQKFQSALLDLHMNCRRGSKLKVSV